MTQLYICQVNLGKSRNAFYELRQFAAENEIDVALIQEPYTYDGAVKESAPLGARIVQRSSRSTQAAIIVYNKNVTVTQIEQYTDEYVACAQLIVNRAKIYVVSVYCKYSLPIDYFLSKLEKIIAALKNENLIIGVDSNAHSKTWYCKDVDAAGDAVEEFVAIKEIYILNETGNPPTFSTVNGDSNIDLTIVNSKSLIRTTN